MNNFSERKKIRSIFSEYFILYNIKKRKTCVGKYLFVADELESAFSKYLP